MTQNPPHTVADLAVRRRARSRSSAGLARRARAEPIRLPGRDSEPEPDRCVVRGSVRDYEDRHPGPDDIALVVEVPTPAWRRTASWPRGLRARPVPVYWIIDLVLARSRSTPTRAREATALAP